MTTYSFLDVTASIVGPGLACSLGADSGTAEEGISLEPEGTKNTRTIGADGSYMNSLRAGNPATYTIRLLKNSPANAILMAAYNAQRISSALWGKNVITVVQENASDTAIGVGCAFQKPPNLEYAVEGGIVSWVFDVGKHTGVLGTYS